MTPEQHKGLPDKLTVRAVKVARHILVTTLLDHRKVREDDLSELYARRRNVERVRRKRMFVQNDEKVLNLTARTPLFASTRNR